jgi:biotin synthase
MPTSEQEFTERLAPLAGFWGFSTDQIRNSNRLDLNRNQLLEILSLPLLPSCQSDASSILKSLYTAANLYTTKCHGDKVHYRGLLEFSNICRNDCNYCGIRKGVKSNQINRYILNEETILETAKWSDKRQYGSIMLQSGDVDTPQRLKFLTRIIQRIVNETNLGVSLSVGELPDYAYQQLFEAGAKRYLLRIETSNPKLFARLHPPRQTFEARLDRLRALKRIGFMVGTGVMIALPGQTLADLVNDLLFFRTEDVDMIGTIAGFHDDNAALISTVSL